MELALFIFILVTSALLLISPLLFLLFLHPKKAFPPASASVPSRIQKVLNQLTRRPNDPNRLRTLALLYLSNKEPAQALPLLKRLRQLSETNRLINRNEVQKYYAIALARTGAVDAAYPLLKESFFLHPHDFEVVLTLGITEYRKQLFESSHDRLLALYASHPDNTEIPKYLALNLFRLRKFKAAVLYFELLIQRSLPDSETLFTYALTCYSMHRTAPALEFFERTRPFPEWATQSLFYIAKIHRELKHDLLAVKYFTDLLSENNLPPDWFCYAHYTIATSLLHQKQISEAFEHLKSIEAVKPNYKDIPFLIEQYAPLADNANLGGYLLASTKEFADICRQICFHLFPNADFNILELSLTGGQYLDLYTEMITQKWQGFLLFRFIRGVGAISDFILREAYAKMKELKAYKCYCFTAGVFSDDSRQFTEGRPIELYEKNALRSILKEMPQIHKSKDDAPASAAEPSTAPPTTAAP